MTVRPGLLAGKMLLALILDPLGRSSTIQTPTVAKRICDRLCIPKTLSALMM
jgi:hypothetical protein